MTILLFGGQRVKGYKGPYIVQILYFCYIVGDVRHWLEYIKPNIYASANKVAGFRFVQSLIMHWAEAYISTTCGRISF